MCGFLGLTEELFRLCVELCFGVFDLIGFEMVFQKSFGKEMHKFCKGFGKCFSVFSVYGGPRGRGVVLSE